MDIYFRPLYLDDKQIHNDIVELLQRERVTRELSVFVEMRIEMSGEVTLMIKEVSIYDGYTLRCISPSAESVILEIPFGAYHTSIRRQTLSFADDIASNIGGDLAVECSNSGVVGSIGGGAVFGIHNRHVIASTAFNSVERELVIRAVRECGFELTEGVIKRADLHIFDELFYCDHYGITAISRYEKRRYMSITSEKIAQRLATPWISLDNI